VKLVVVDLNSYIGDSLVCLIIAVVCLLAAPRAQLFAGVGNGWPYCALRHH